MKLPEASAIVCFAIGVILLCFAGLIGYWSYQAVALPGMFWCLPDDQVCEAMLMGANDFFPISGMICMGAMLLICTSGLFGVLFVYSAFSEKNDEEMAGLVKNMPSEGQNKA